MPSPRTDRFDKLNFHNNLFLRKILRTFDHFMLWRINFKYKRSTSRSIRITLVSAIERKTFNVLTRKLKSHSELVHKRDHYLL